MEDKQTLTTQEIVERLIEINKDELSERQFFQEILSVIKDMKDFDLTEESFAEISKTLREIGCVDYETWMEEKEKIGFPMTLKPNDQGIEEGLLVTAESYINKYLSDYLSARSSLHLMTEGGDKSGWVQRWLRNSQKVLREEKNNSDREFEFYEPELRDRKREERELEERKARKSQLTLEIQEIKEQIDKLEIEEATLKNSKIRKEIELKGLEEK